MLKRQVTSAIFLAIAFFVCSPASAGTCTKGAKKNACGPCKIESHCGGTNSTSYCRAKASRACKKHSAPGTVMTNPWVGTWQIQPVLPEGEQNEMIHASQTLTITPSGTFEYELLRETMEPVRKSGNYTQNKRRTNFAAFDPSLANCKIIPKPKREKANAVKSGCEMHHDGMGTVLVWHKDPKTRKRVLDRWTQKCSLPWEGEFSSNTMQTIIKDGRVTFVARMGRFGLFYAGGLCPSGKNPWKATMRYEFCSGRGCQDGSEELSPVSCSVSNIRISHDRVENFRIKCTDYDPETMKRD